jgi:uncharacterized protein (DUF433 family)
MKTDVIKIDRDSDDGNFFFAGTSVSVESLFDYLEKNIRLGDFINDHPSIPPERVFEVLKMAQESLFGDVGSQGQSYAVTISYDGTRRNGRDLNAG